MFETTNLEAIIIAMHLALVILFLIFVRYSTREKRVEEPREIEEKIPLATESTEEEPIAPAAEETVPPPVGESEILEEPPLETEPPPEPAPPSVSLEEGLKKTREGFFGRIGAILSRKKTIERETIAEIEELLFTADIGVQTADKLLSFIKEALDRDKLNDPAELQKALKEHIRKILSVPAPPLEFDSKKPFTIMIVGVNGVGKTTTIGKLAEKFRKEGKSSLLAAGDTFRAAAVEQLEIWANRSQAGFVKGKPNADPSAVIFDGIKTAKQMNIDIVLADTAGRLHTKIPLMEELKKIKRVMSKAREGAPDEIWLVLDATTGQNAIAQAQQFKEALGEITGIIITKLDGTAKGGVIVGISEQFKIPVRYIGIGEKTEDLRPFDPQTFADALFD
ncbi:MAG: signal recognition particle-docking protein FtsY [Myxococcota bacterium]